MNKKQLFKQVTAKPVYSLLSDTESDQTEEENLQTSEKSEIPAVRSTEKMSKEKRKKTKAKRYVAKIISGNEKNQNFRQKSLIRHAYQKF